MRYDGVEPRRRTRRKFDLTDVAPRDERERLAIQMALAKSRKFVRYRVVTKPASRVIYDWVDVEGDRMGQCETGVFGEWLQEPLGENPVILTIGEHP